MEQSPLRRRLAVWVGIGGLLAAGTAALGVYVGVSAALGLGAIVATVYSGTLIFIQQDPKRQRHANHEIQGKLVEPDMNQAEESESKDIQELSWEAAQGHSTTCNAWGESNNYAWHPALNRVEDVLVAQLWEATTIIDIVERVGMNPGTMPRGHGSAATLWHSALRSAWITGGEELICEILRTANKMEPSKELRSLITNYCGQR
jgi:hypothetical protein